MSLNLWRPPSVALYAKVLHVLGTDRKAVVESLFWEIMLTVSHLEEPGYGTNCHCQEEPPTLSPLVGSEGAARFLLVQAPTPALASATTRVGCPRPFAADAARTMAAHVFEHAAGTPRGQTPIKRGGALASIAFFEQLTC